MKDEARLALDSLTKENEKLGKGGTDGSPDITPVRNYERRNVIQNDDGTWGETITEEESPVRKDVEQRANELEGFEIDAANYENFAKIGDNKVIQILVEINDKKAGIITTVNAAVSAGCSVLTGNGLWGKNGITVGGVVLSAPNTQTVYNTNYPKFTKDKGDIFAYDGLNNYMSDAPFAGITSSMLIETNVGTGFSTGAIVNTGDEIVGLYKTITTDISVGGACAGYLATVNALASEIDTLRDSLGTDWAAGNYVGVLKDTVEVKDKKTDSELFIWAYNNSDEKIQQKQSSNNSLIETIESQSEYQ